MVSSVQMNNLRVLSSDSLQKNIDPNSVSEKNWVKPLLFLAGFLAFGFVSSSLCNRFIPKVPLKFDPKILRPDYNYKNPLVSILATLGLASFGGAMVSYSCLIDSVWKSPYYDNMVALRHGRVPSIFDETNSKETEPEYIVAEKTKVKNNQEEKIQEKQPEKIEKNVPEELYTQDEKEKDNPPQYAFLGVCLSKN